MPSSDHFSPVARTYAQARPHYPAVLFAWLSGLCGRHDLAWDCGAGSGQASVALAQHFASVIATDSSAAQIVQAAAHPRVVYRVAPAEASGLEAGSVDLVTVAQALHWFDVTAFFDEVRRVLRPGGVLAVWTYGIQTVAGDEVDRLVQSFYQDEVGPYWPPERRHVEDGYRSIPFPFDPIDAPVFSMSVDWTLDELLAYFRSWSATARYTRERGVDPVADLAVRLARVWGDPLARRRVEWPLSVLAGRV
ncbi:MAG: class I SAM-dependent methyltransferase [Castellaniella sp.]|nr:class I SAM-dependent methyltransferase [Castellaniella sp.]